MYMCVCVCIYIYVCVCIYIYVCVCACPLVGAVRQSRGMPVLDTCAFPQMPEEEAFAVFVKIMYDYGVREMFKVRRRKNQRMCETLATEHATSSPRPGLSVCT